MKLYWETCFVKLYFWSSPYFQVSKFKVSKFKFWCKAEGWGDAGIVYVRPRRWPFVRLFVYCWLSTKGYLWNSNDGVTLQHLPASYSVLRDSVAPWTQREIANFQKSKTSYNLLKYWPLAVKYLPLRRVCLNLQRIISCTDMLNARPVPPVPNSACL